MIEPKFGRIFNQSVSGLVVKSIVAIDGPRVRFAADASGFAPRPMWGLLVFFSACPASPISGELGAVS